MKRTKSLLVALLTALVLFSFSAAAFAEDNGAPDNVITVSGSGTVKVAPNTAEVSFAVITEATEAGAAQTRNATIVNKVLAALKNSGISQNDLVTSGYNLNPKYVYEENKAPRITGYEVRNEITVTVRNINSTGKVIDLAVQNGINQVQNIQFYYEGGKELKARALRQAVEDARSKAEIIAAALGKKIAGIKSATGGWYDNAPPPVIYYDNKMAGTGGAGAPTPISPGLAEIKASADITYLFQ
ncbi:SIMPL domain-containing protein [Desulfotruncus alcoholivorax]|uniref:SIMPL domain-containing protein n=1 Tax=Desulfotruncus alcoholivorax TaxID=265477 RepID=UPI000425F89C|nr:SIMPL domain-containing protein [Desulfotruncus alcoholivorax]